MNKAEFVIKVAEATDLSKAAAEKALNSVFDVLACTLANDENITLVGFGTFSVVKRAARTGRNPQTGKAIKIAEKKVVKFKAGKKLKDALCCAKVKGKAGCGCKTAKPMAKKK